MMKQVLCYVLSLCLTYSGFSQDDSLQNSQSNPSAVTDTLRTNFPTKNSKGEQVYLLKPAADIPVFAIGAGWSGYAFTKIYHKSPTPEETILGLDKNKINGFDRWAVRPFSK